MVGVLVIIGFWTVVGACSVAHNLRRIADAIEAQNRAYGVETETRAAGEEAV